MSDEITTPTDIRERRRSQAEAAPRPRPQDHLGKGGEPRDQEFQPRDLSKPIEVKYLDETFMVYPRALDDFSQVERLAGIDLDLSENSEPVPGYDALLAEDAQVASIWDSLWRFLGWGTLSNEDVYEEYRILRGAIYKKYGYCSTQLVLKFSEVAAEEAQKALDPEGNSNRSRTS